MDYKKLMKFIKQSLRRRKTSPTVREIAKKFGLNSTSAVHYHLQKLKGKGKLMFRYSQNKTNRRVARGLKPL